MWLQASIFALSIKPNGFRVLLKWFNCKKRRKEMLSKPQQFLWRPVKTWLAGKVEFKGKKEVASVVYWVFSKLSSNTSDEVALLLCCFYYTVTHIRSMFPFSNQRKRQKISGFMMFSRVIEMEHYPFKRQLHSMVKHPQAIPRHQPTNCLSVFNHFVGLVFKGLTWMSILL